MTAQASEAQEARTSEADDLRKRIDKERCDAICLLNLHDLTEHQANVVRTQINRLTELEGEMRRIMSLPPPSMGCGSANVVRLAVVGAILAAGAAVCVSASERPPVAIAIGLLAVTTAFMVYYFWQSLGCCGSRRERALVSAQGRFVSVRRIMRRAHRVLEHNGTDRWEVGKALGASPDAAEFWSMAFGPHRQKVAAGVFSTRVSQWLLTKQAREYDRRKGNGPGEGAQARLAAAKDQISALIRYCADAGTGSGAEFVTARKFRVLLQRFGPINELLFNVLDVIEPAKAEFRPWFLISPLSTKDLGEVAQAQKGRELEHSSFLVCPARLSGPGGPAFRLVRYTRSSLKYAADPIYHSNFGFFAGATEAQIRKIFAVEDRIAQIVQKITRFDEDRVDLIIEYVTVAPPVFECLSQLVRFYQSQGKLNGPVAFLPELAQALA